MGRGESTMKTANRAARSSNLNLNLVALVAAITLFLALVASCTEPNYGDGPFPSTGKCPVGYQLCNSWCYPEGQSCPDVGVPDMKADSKACPTCKDAGTCPDGKICHDKGTCPTCPDKGPCLDQYVPDMTSDMSPPDMSMCIPACVNGGKCIPKTTSDGGVGDAGMDATANDATITSSYICQCPKPYSGPQCQGCASGYIYWGGKCITDPCTTCTANGGICTFNAKGQGQKVCTCPTQNYDPAKDCGSCLPGYGGPSCERLPFIGGGVVNIGCTTCAEGKNYTLTFYCAYTKKYDVKITTLSGKATKSSVVTPSSGVVTYTGVWKLITLDIKLGEIAIAPLKERISVTVENDVSSTLYVADVEIKSSPPPDAGPPGG